MKIWIQVFWCMFSIAAIGQSDDEARDYYYHIPDASEEYNPGNLVARMIDGLGYRFYWATKDLREEDLDYRPSEEARNTAETIAHIRSLSSTILKTVKGEVNAGGGTAGDLPAMEQRNLALDHIRNASEHVRGMTEQQIAELKIRFQRGDNSIEFPFWNLINGPIADAIYHTGQIVSFRRSSGNPVSDKVNVLTGRTRG
jgi:hypothetical protein